MVYSVCNWSHQDKNTTPPSRAPCTILILWNPHQNHKGEETDGRNASPKSFLIIAHQISYTIYAVKGLAC